MDDYRRLLYGRSPAVSVQVGLLACGLFALSLAVFYTNVVHLWPLPVIPSGAVLLVGIAAIEAYYNEGLVAAWLLTFSVTVPAFFYPPRDFIDGVARPSTVIAVGLAGGVAMILGMLGFAIGVGLRRSREQHRTETSQPSPTVLPTVLLGRDDSITIRAVLVAVGEIVVFFVIIGTGAVPDGIGLGGIPGLLLMGVLMTVPALLYAARNSGLLVCWALAFAPVFGFALAVQVMFNVYPEPSSPILYAIGVSLLFGIPLGTVGFLLGMVGRRIQRRHQSRSGPNANPE